MKATDLQVIEDREVLHRDWSGIVIGRVQKILNTLTGEVTEVRFWYENDRIHHVDSVPA